MREQLLLSCCRCLPAPPTTTTEISDLSLLVHGQPLMPAAPGGMEHEAAGRLPAFGKAFRSSLVPEDGWSCLKCTLINRYVTID